MTSRAASQLALVRNKQSIRAWTLTIVAAIAIGITAGLVVKEAIEPEPELIPPKTLTAETIPATFPIAPVTREP